MASKHNYSGIVIDALIVIVLITVLISLKSCATDTSRKEHNMILIEKGYCYDNDTRVIYIESLSSSYGHTTYAPYYNTEGELCRYNVETGD